MPSSLSDKVIEWQTSGSEEVLRELYEGFYPVVLESCRKNFKFHAGTFEFDELLSIAYLKLKDILRNWNPDKDDNVEDYVSGRLYFRLIDYFRANKFGRRFGKEAMQTTLDVHMMDLTGHGDVFKDILPWLGKNPEEEAILSDLREIIRGSVSCLSESQCFIVEKVFFEGKTQREVADLLGCGEANVTNHLARVRKKLKSYLLRRGVEPGDAELFAGSRLSFDYDSVGHKYV